MASRGMPRGWGSPLAAYAAWMTAAGLPESTRKLRGSHLRRLGREVGRGPFELEQANLIDHLDKPWSANYKRSVRSTLRAFYGWAVLSGAIERDPSARLPRIKAPMGRPRPTPEPLLRSALLEADERVRLMIRLGAQTGLRCAEIASVHTDDIVADLVGCSLRVLGKGDKTRIVPLNDDLAAALLAHPRGWLFPGQIDGHLSPAYVSKLVSRALPVGLTAHTLRHRFASAAFAADRDIRAVQELLGHSSVATTQIYTAVPDGALRRAVAAAA